MIPPPTRHSLSQRSLTSLFKREMLSDNNALEVKVTHQEFTAIALDQILFLMILRSISPLSFTFLEKLHYTTSFVFFFSLWLGAKQRAPKGVTAARCFCDAR